MIADVKTAILVGVALGLVTLAQPYTSHVPRFEDYPAEPVYTEKPAEPVLVTLASSVGRDLQRGQRFLAR